MSPKKILAKASGVAGHGVLCYSRKMRLHPILLTLPLAAVLLSSACRSGSSGDGLAGDHLRRGHALFDEGKYARAHIAFGRAQSLEPSSEEASLWRDLSAVAVAAHAPEVIGDANINELDYAVEFLRDRFPKQAKLLETARGNLLARAGKTDDALAAYRKALDADPGFVPALYFLAQVLSQTGKTTEAEASLRAAAKADPHHAPSRELLARLLAKRKAWDEALAVLRDALTLGANAQLHTLFGDIAAAAGKQGDAEAAYHDALGLDPNDVNALRGSAELLLSAKRFDEAAGMLNRYLEVAQAAGEPSERISRARQIAGQIAALQAPPPFPGPDAPPPDRVKPVPGK